MTEESTTSVAGAAPKRTVRSWPHVAPTCLLVGALVFTAAGAGGSEACWEPAGSPPGKAKTCQQITTSVTGPDGGDDLTIVGELCWRGNLAGKSLQILTSGSTYDHTYWDFPYEPDTYSYVDAATSYGFATFNYDRLGIGGSDLPGGLPESMSIANQADVLHQLVQGARNGQLTGRAFSRVLSVGHSMGSAIAIYEAGTYGDVDALLLTGNMRATQPDFTGVPSYPAVEDPKFADSGLPEVVLTSVPGVRRDMFLHSSVDPVVADLDEDLKATGLLHELITIPTAYQPEIAGEVDVPVLFVVGQDDVLFCNSPEGFLCDSPQDILDRQAPMLPNAPCVDAVVVRGTGHSLNLHPTAPSVFAVVNTYGWHAARGAPRCPPQPRCARLHPAEREAIRCGTGPQRPG